MENNFDLVVIGGGPGGYVCAIRAAQLGLKTACVESRGALGGTCLNVGCIPSKSLLNLSENFHKAQKDFNQQGIEIDGIRLNIEKMMANKNKSIQVLTKGVEFLFKKNKVTYLKGKGVLFSKNDIVVYESNNKRINIKTKNIVVATGSEVVTLPGINIDEKNIVSSTGALSFEKVPKNLAVIGGGYIGLEMGSVWSRLGSEVTVIEYLDYITPGMDREISNEFQKILTKQGIKFKMGSKVNSVNNNRNSVSIKYTNVKDSKEEIIEVDKVLVSVGRKPHTSGLNAQAAGVQINERGQVEVNDHLQTTAANIYAIGDVVRGAMLAHKAEEEGVFVAETIAGQKPHIDYNLIPGVVYTWPEVASVGKTEEQLKEQGIAYKSGQFPMRALGRSRASMDLDGFVKILADQSTDEVLGVHIVGARAADLIMEAAVAMEYRASAEDLARICHGHPTYAEAMKEAAKAAWDGKPLNA